MSDELEAAVAHLAICALRISRDAAACTDRDRLAACLADMRSARAQVNEAYADVEKALLAVAGEKRFEVPMVGVVEVKRRTKRSGWDHDYLLRAVLDSRRVNTATGEIVDETPVDKVASVYALKGYNASLEAIRARGLDPDEFCRAEPDGWSVKLPTRGLT